MLSQHDKGEMILKLWCRERMPISLISEQTGVSQHKVKMYLQQEGKIDANGRAKKLPAVDHKGHVFKSIDDMCNHYGVKVSTVKGRWDRGWGMEQALTVKA